MRNTCLEVWREWALGISPCFTKDKKARNERSNTRALLKKLNQIPDNRITPAESWWKGIGTVPNGYQAGYNHLNLALVLFSIFALIQMSVKAPAVPHSDLLNCWCAIYHWELVWCVTNTLSMDCYPFFVEAWHIQRRFSFYTNGKKKFHHSFEKYFVENWKRSR